MFEDDFEGEEDQIINEEFKIWKKNTSWLYDTLLIKALESPSMTINWLPEIEIKDNFKVQRFILGTQTTANEQNYLIIAKAILPIAKDDANQRHFHQEDIEAYSRIEDKIEIECRINHQGEVNKARAMPQKNKTSIIATKTPSGEIHIFDYKKHPFKPNDMQISPQMKLTGHTKEGFGLCWSKLKEGFLLSGSDDHRVCVWDINSGMTTALKIFDDHKAVVEDVDWNKQMENIFTSCGDDRRMIIWDIRQDTPIQCVEAHVQEVNSVEFNPFNPLLLITSSNDKSCALWDMRNLGMKLHRFEHHKNDVVAARWNPRIMSLFASFSSDRRVNVWDLSNLGKNTTPEDTEDGPVELLFTHGGHTSRISDMDWNPSEDLMCASVSDDNIVQLWEMADALYFNDEDQNK